MIDLGQYDAIKSDPSAASADHYGNPITDMERNAVHVTLIYQVYAEPDTLVAEFSDRRAAHECLNKDFDNRYIRKLTPEKWCSRYGYERVLTHKTKHTVAGQCQHLVGGQWRYIPMNDQWRQL